MDLEILKSIVYIIIGFIGLYYGGDFFVDSAISIAKKFKISSLVIGIVIVGFGTSLPEFIISLLALLKGSQSIAIGNVFGSNITNVLLILGLSAILSPIAFPKIALTRDSVFLFLSYGALILVLLNFNDFHFQDLSGNFLKGATINNLEGVFLFALLLIYIAFAYFHDKKHPELLENPSEEDEKPENMFKVIVFLVLGMVILFVGSNLLIDGSQYIALNVFKVPTRIVAVTIVAYGTSLPELSVSLMAIIKKEDGISLGNIIGSNIFNILGVLGLSSMFKSIHITDGNFMKDFIIMIFASFLLVFIGLVRRKVSRLSGALFVLVYALYFYFFLLH